MNHDFGPQNPSDGPLLRRVRLHQSWYRAEVLGLSRWGATRGRSSKELGSVLSNEDAATGLNFVSRNALNLYRTRHAEGWGVDPRCSAYMTSSQALTINIFGALSQDSAWLLECLRAWLTRGDLHRVVSVQIEFAPSRRSLHLNDQTRIDALVVVEGERGAEVVAVEVKYADRFNSRLVDIATPRYQELARRTGLWSDASRVFADHRVNQLVRIHALAASYALSRGIDAHASLLVLSHELDPHAAEVVDVYRAGMNEPVVHSVTLGSACDSIANAAPARHAKSAEDLRLRYGSEARSSDLAPTSSYP